MSDETNLLSCPFCGGETELKEYKPNVSGVAICKECGVRSPICKNDHTGGWRPKAIAEWNTRAPVEYDGWFYLPKPKESIVQYGEQRTEKTEHGYKVTQPVEVIESAIRSWSDELGKYIMKRICEAWSTRAELGSGTCELVETDSYSNANEVVHVLECSACGETCEHVNGAYPRCPHCGAKAVER